MVFSNEVSLKKAKFRYRIIAGILVVLGIRLQWYLAWDGWPSGLPFINSIGVMVLATVAVFACICMVMPERVVYNPSVHGGIIEPQEADDTRNAGE